jgi:hypothetical protein
VGAPAADVPELKQVVADAREDGIDLKIVVIGKNPPVETPLRDIATGVGHVYPGSTVPVLSPSYAGTYCPTFDRITLEAGQDVAKTGGGRSTDLGRRPHRLRQAMGIAVRSVGSALDSAVHYQPAGLCPTSGLQSGRSTCPFMTAISSDADAGLPGHAAAA